jgi:hypothetical protein
LIVIDNFLKDGRAFKALSSSPFWGDPSFYWHLMSDLDNGIGSYVVSCILETELARRFPFENVLGFEYWPGVFSPADTHIEQGSDGDSYHLPIHVDKDENLYRATGEIIYPLFGAILYFLDSPIVGGELKYWTSKDDFVLVEPANNMLIMLDPTMPHGVREVKMGTRRSLTINFWDHVPELEGMAKYS